MNTDLDAVTESIIGAAFEVSNHLGAGFLETVYRRALACELRLRGLDLKEETRFAVHYKGQEIGTYVADIIVAGTVVVELKALDALTGAHSAQVINYLKASRLPLGLLLNFGKPKVEVKRLRL